MVDGEWIPIAMAMAAVAIVAIVMHFRNERIKVQAAGGGDYRRLAEEAVNAQRAMVEETQRMNATLREIEKLLREV